jgi:hypothetical protein
MATQEEDTVALIKDITAGADARVIFDPVVSLLTRSAARCTNTRQSGQSGSTRQQNRSEIITFS